MKQNNVIIVFDAYKVKGNQREIEKYGNVSVVYTKEAETADTYIEKTSRELSRNYKVRVATSDGQVQMIVFGNNAVRVSAAEFIEEIKNSEKEMRSFIDENNR
jgi:predicted RNA-binding protein with PIN domain